LGAAGFAATAGGEGGVESPRDDTVGISAASAAITIIAPAARA
jgi:hypothetical protein